MNVGSFIFGVAVGVVAAFIVNVTTGIAHGIWEYTQSLLRDLQASWIAWREHRYDDSTMHGNRAALKAVGCSCLLVTIYFFVIAGVVVAALLTTQKH